MTCDCGSSYDLKDEFAGKLVKCPHCGRPSRTPSVGTAVAEGDPAFDRDIFLLRQQLLRISAKYDVGDEQGNKIIFVERPAHLLRNLAAVLAAFAVIIVAIGLIGSLDNTAGLATPMQLMAPIVGLLLIFVGAPAVGIALSVKRHVTFYRDESKREKLLDILQDKKFQPITMTYTVRDDRGRALARLGKNWLYNIFRKRWYVWAPAPSSGGGRRLLFVAKEDSIILSLLRRFLGPMFGLLRTNFVFIPAGTEDVIGEFKRKFTILDRYVLDMSADPQRLMDRRIAIALGVMLDTGERR
ncbi:MAG TPA: hypothetical protein VJ755_07300 [Gemmatimonadales bacterium]|nr:hypothetical protein [Gemmatimonadales bacterium]